MTDQLNELHTRLAQVRQEHLLKFWSELSADERTKLARDIDELCLDEIKLYWDRATISMNANGIKLDGRLQPIPDGQILSTARTTPDKLSAYREEGLQQISHGHVAVLLMAGGQGEFMHSISAKIMYIRYEVKKKKTR